MTMNATERRRGSRLPVYVDRGMGWQRGGAMLALSLLLHGGAIWLAGFMELAPLMTDNVAAAAMGDPTEIDFFQVEPEPEVVPTAEIAEIEPAPTTDIWDVVPEPTPKTIELRGPIATQRVTTPTKLRPRGVSGGSNGSALAAGGNSPGGWSTPKPTYPYQARRLRLQGSGGVRVTTNGIGRVVIAEMQPGIDPTLDTAATSHARLAWTGPPNATRTVAITFLLE